MPISVQQLKANTKPVSFPYDGETVNLTVRPAAFTEDTLAAFNTFAQTKGNDIAALVEEIKALNSELCKLVASWDVLDGDAMFPLDPARLGDLPLLFRIEVLNHAVQAVNLGEANGTPSSVASPPTPSSSAPDTSNPSAA